MESSVLSQTLSQSLSLSLSPSERIDGGTPRDELKDVEDCEMTDRGAVPTAISPLDSSCSRIPMDSPADSGAECRINLAPLDEDPPDVEQPDEDRLLFLFQTCKAQGPFKTADDARDMFWAHNIEDFAEDGWPVGYSPWFERVKGGNVVGSATFDTKVPAMVCL